MEYPQTDFGTEYLLKIIALYYCSVNTRSILFDAQEEKGGRSRLWQVGNLCPDES